MDGLLSLELVVQSVPIRSCFEVEQPDLQKYPALASLGLQKDVDFASIALLFSNSQARLSNVKRMCTDEGLWDVVKVFGRYHEGCLTSWLPLLHMHCST